MYPIVLTLAFTLLGMLALIYLHSVRRISDIYLVGLLAYAWGVLTVYVCLKARQRQLLRSWLPEDSLALSEHRLKLGSDGLDVSDRVGTSKFSWQDFKEIEQSGDLIVLWYEQGAGVRVPARAFATEEMRQTFIDTVRQHLPRAGT